jgi:hypothetical protein
MNQRPGVSILRPFQRPPPLPPLVKLFLPFDPQPDSFLCGWCISRTKILAEPCHACTSGGSLELIQQNVQSIDTRRPCNALLLDAALQ